MLDRMGCDPIVGMAMIANNNLPCGVCRGESRTRYPLSDERLTCDCMEDDDRPNPKCWKCDGTGRQTLNDRICQSCYGTLYEACSPELRGKMYAELAQYESPKRKAIEHSGPEGGDIPLSILVEFVDT